MTGAVAEASWNCLDIEAPDSVGILLLWHLWDRHLPAALLIQPGLSA